jgi:adenylate cyclase
VDDERERLRAALEKLGVSADLEAVAADGDDSALFPLVYEEYLWGGPPTMTAEQMGARTGFDSETVRRLWGRLGFPDPDARAVFRDADEVTFRLAHAGSELFGLEEVEQFSLVVGMAVRRITDAANALSTGRLDALDLDLADRLEQGAGATNLLRAVAEDMVPTILLHSLQAALEYAAQQRSEGGGRLCVGFCDLAGSTTLLNSDRSPDVLAALARFQMEANDIVVRNRGQLVKFVGDEFMFSVPSPEAAIAIGQAAIAWVGGEAVLDTARLGIAVGNVIQRDGDLFGPTVNRAARLAGRADPGTLLIDADLVDQGPEIRVELRGFAEPVPARALPS